MNVSIFGSMILAATLSIAAVGAQSAQDGPLVLSRQGDLCTDDPNCFNRMHPDIPMVARARPGQIIVLDVRNAGDVDLDLSNEWTTYQPPGSTVHPITGPVHIEGGEAGDVLAVTLLDVDPGPLGYTIISVIGFVTDRIEGPYQAVWSLDRDYATSEQMPGVRIPNAGFPGILTTLPDARTHARMAAREEALRAVGGNAAPPETAYASPASICGPEGSDPGGCLRTFPPREHGGNMDIRNMQAGVTVYLPCFIDGCGLGVGDTHYAQGDGEVSGTAIEMDATVTLTTRIIKNKELPRGPHFEGPASLLRIPSSRFYATTGFPLKEAGTVPADMAYLNAHGRIAPLANLSKDVSLATRNALLEMIDYIVDEKGLTREQAYILSSVAVDLRISQLVDAPNVGVTAILPLDVFVGD